MVTIDESVIRRVAEIARLNLSPAEVKKFVPEFNEILAAFSKLDMLDVGDTEVSLHAVELRNRMRDDVPKPCLTNEEALAQTIHKKDGSFKGPRIL
ncbi:MAG: Asp-tRNA(Asn)/Glu-tRNA(Gln) amidotransferase subunit GatC [Candidatus Woesearchaeota archaeon]|nr:Asp-tRNA(Asn)/Glu-tRNA(Gln) amidotransferase subunit GatC [Candidatus Woesearchaeota archaeon]